MKDTVLKESYVERFVREQKEKSGIPVNNEGIPVNNEGIPEEAEKNILGKQQKEGKEHGTNARGKGHKAQTE